jgi:hypothetical protein
MFARLTYALSQGGGLRSTRRRLQGLPVVVVEPGKLIERGGYEIHVGALLDERLPEKEGGIRSGW